MVRFFCKKILRVGDRIADEAPTHAGHRADLDTKLSIKAVIYHVLSLSTLLLFRLLISSFCIPPAHPPLI